MEKTELNLTFVDERKNSAEENELPYKLLLSAMLIVVCIKAVRYELIEGFLKGTVFHVRLGLIF